MDTISEVSEELLAAAAAGGPDSTDPHYVRQPFPLVALPLVLRRFVQQSADALGVPVECIAMPAIATCATAIGNTCRVRVQPMWIEPAIIWAVLLMPSGSLKTPAYNAALAPLQEAQQRAEEQFRKDYAVYRDAKALYDAAMKPLTPDGLPGEYLGEAPQEEPAAPKPVDYYTSDSTVEAVAMLFKNNPRGLALTRDELSGFFESFGAYKGGRGGDEAAYLECYNAGSIKINRASGKRIFVESAPLSIFGTCQPPVFDQAIGLTGGQHSQVENGLAARFIMAAPRTAPKRWREPKPFDTRPYHDMVAALLAIPLQRDADGRAEPAFISLLPAAQARMKQFVNEHGRMTAAISNRALHFHYSKLEAVAARLALIFYLCDRVTQQPSAATGEGGGGEGVTERHMLSGIALARWFGREAQRVYDGHETAHAREIRELLDVIRAHGGTITPRELSRTRRKWSDPEKAELALRTLVREGWGTLEMEEPLGGIGRSCLRFRLYDDLEATPDQAVATPPEQPIEAEAVGSTGNADLP